MAIFPISKKNPNIINTPPRSGNKQGTQKYNFLPNWTGIYEVVDFYVNNQSKFQKHSNNQMSH